MGYGKFYSDKLNMKKAVPDVKIKKQELSHALQKINQKVTQV
jgi:hypothetical protein